MLIDAHCHLDFAAFDNDRDKVIKAANSVGVKHFIVPATTFAHWQHVLALGERSDISTSLGLHPYFIEQHREQHLDALEQHIVQQKGLVGVGECGIDGRFNETLKQQWYYFDAQLKIAKQHALPVVIHCVKANDSVSKRLRQLALPKGGLIHAFGGSYEQAVKFIDLGYLLGLGGAVTFERAQRLRSVVKRLPDDSFVLETDSPDMPLSGYQGQRNEPSRVEQVGKVVAFLRNQTLEEIASLSSANAARLFGLRLS